MPVIEIRDAWAQYYRIDSRNDETIGLWFKEILREIWPSPDPPQIMISSRIWKDNIPDWPMGNANGYMPFTFKTASDAMRELAKLKEKGPWPYGNIH